LFSEFVITGPVALVWDIKEKRELFREMVNDLEHGKKKCEECVKGLLNKAPTITWTHQP
jgi:hypothetical protein